MKKWAPSLKFFMMHASNQEEQLRQRKLLFDHGTEYDVILTTYEMAKVPTMLHFYPRMKFHYLVLDEGHKIKSHETIVSQTMRKIHAGNKLLLTGTPLQNNLVELWSLMNFLYPDIFTVCEPFEKHFDLKDNIIDKAFLAKTQKLLELFMLRRLKKEVEKLIPEKLETKVYCPLSKVQTFWYKALLMKDVDKLSNVETTGGEKISTESTKLLRSLFMQLRKCSNHPFSFPGAETNPDETTLETLVGASGKLSVLDMLLRSLFQKGNRAVLFTQFTMVLDLIEDYCRMRGWRYCRLDGSTDRARRNYLIKRFNEPNSEHFLFLMSTRSGGMGLNLQTADTCILYDSDWNPQSDIQAMARVHRIGQKNTVHVYRLVTAGTVEERMLERAEKKLLLEMVNRESSLSNEAMDELDPEASARGLTAGELWEDIKFGCEAVFGNSSDNELPSEKDIDEITNRKRKESDSVGKLTGGTALSSKSFDASKEFSQSQLFGGADFREIRMKQAKEEKKLIPKNLQGIAHLWHDIKTLENKKRERKSRICQIAGKGSGYGSAYVPVLAANNYTFGGESSVFERELKQSNKSCFEVKKKSKDGPKFEHDDYCIICGDGGDMVCCSRCPNTVHLSCVGLKKSRDFSACPHHKCSKCGKGRGDAGGLLFPCHVCPHSFCEDCLPEKGVTFLERVERFEKLGFDSTKHVVYINCSDYCEKYAIAEYGYVPSKSKGSKRRVCPEKLNLTGHFGASYDLKEAGAAVAEEKEKEASTGPGKRNIARKNYSLGRVPKTSVAADTATPAKLSSLVTYSKPASTPKIPQPQQTQNLKSNDTPSTSATDACSDTSSYCSVVEAIKPIPDSSGRDAKHAIEIADSSGSDSTLL